MNRISPKFNRHFIFSDSFHFGLEPVEQVLYNICKKPKNIKDNTEENIIKKTVSLFDQVIELKKYVS